MVRRPRRCKILRDPTRAPRCVLPAAGDADVVSGPIAENKLSGYMPIHAVTAACRRFFPVVLLIADLLTQNCLVAHELYVGADVYSFQENKKHAQRDQHHCS